MQQIIRRIFLFLNVLVAIVLLSCRLVPLISPNQFWPLTFIGLGFLIWLGLNLFFFLYWVLSWRKWFLISAVAIGVNLGNVSAYFGTTNSSPAMATNSISVATLNTQLFGFFDATKKSKPDWEKDVVNTIKALNPDFLCFQEFLSYKKYNLNYYKRKLDYKYAYFKVLKDGRKKGTFGMTIFSKYPISNSGGMEFSKYTGNMGAWIETEVNGQKLKLINVHLQSIKFSKADYQVIEKPKKDIRVEESKTLLKRIKNASTTRAKQVDQLASFVKSSDVPVFVCGDFNEPPVSYSYGKMKSLLADAYTQTTFGLETTYTGKFPAYRIDYIFHDNKFKAIEYKSKFVPSDHKLVFAKIKL